MKFGDLCVSYVESPDWIRLKPASRRIYMSGIDALGEDWLKLDADEITRPMVIGFRDAMYHKPGRCRIGLTVLNNVLSYGYDRGYVKQNVATRIRNLPPSVPIKRWEMEEVDAFIDTAPSYLRHAVILALYTGQRRSDIVRMKWDQFDGRTLKIRQEKTGKDVRIPVHKKLRSMLKEVGGAYLPGVGAMTGRSSPYILHNAYKQPWATETLSAGVVRHAKKIGIHGKTIHGLRKTAASTLAEIGCSPHEIAAITGQSLKEVENYTREADQTRMTQTAIDRWDAQSADMVAGPDM